MVDEDLPKPGLGREPTARAGFVADTLASFRSMCDDIEALSPGRRFALTFVFGALAAAMILRPDGSPSAGSRADCMPATENQADAPRVRTRGPVTSFCMGTVKVEVPGRFDIDGKSEVLSRGPSGRWSETLELSGSGNSGEDRTVKITVDSQARR